MFRSLIAVLSIITVTACVQLPGRAKDAGAGSLDGSVVAELAVDGSVLRPPMAPPYTGPQGTASNVRRMDAAVSHADAAVSRSALDAGSVRAAAPGLGVTSSTPPTDGGTQSAPTRPSATGQIVITEIMANPSAVSDTDGEWIELHNPSAVDALDLNGCAVDDGSKTPHAINMPLYVEPGAYVTIARSVNAGFAADLLLGISLSNDADAVALLCQGVAIDRVAYGSGFPLAPGASMSLDPGSIDAARNDAASAWCLARLSYGSDLGTPGAPNPACDADAADAGAD